MGIVKSGNPFVKGVPSAQNAFDLFESWASRLPDHFNVKAGSAGLFDDPRISWANEKLLALNTTGFKSRTVLELGPLEGGHTHSISRAGAASVVAVEANSEAFLKCLVAKEIVGITNAQFLLGDGVAFLDECIASRRRFDVCVCCGFLYHMRDPLGLIKAIAAVSDSIFLWSITYHESLFAKNPGMDKRFGAGEVAELDGFSCMLYPQYYGDDFNIHSFRGGMDPDCRWMKAEDIEGALRHFGFSKLEVVFEENPFGLAVSIVGAKGA